MVAKVIKEAIKQQLTLEADNEYDTRHKSGCEAWVTNIKIQRKLMFKNNLNLNLHNLQQQRNWLVEGVV